MDNQTIDTPMAGASDTAEIESLQRLVEARRAEMPAEAVRRFGDLSATIERIKSHPPPEPESEESLRTAAYRARSGIMSQLLHDAGGERFYRCSFKDYVAISDRQKRVLAACQEFSASIRDRCAAGENLLLYGPVGTGKDHLAFAVCWWAVMAGDVESAGWANGQAWFGKVRDAIDDETPEAAIIAAALRPQIFVISDPQPPIGTLTQHQASMLYRLIDARYCARKTTIVTINVANDEEADKRLGAATWDRVNDRAWKCFCSWESARKPARVIQ